MKFNENQYKLGSDEFESVFLRNTGLQYFYNREFELSTPLINNLSSKLALYELYDYISNLQNNLEHALRTLRVSKSNSSDYLQVLTLIRQPLDGMILLKNKSTLITNLAKELYIDKKVFEDVAPSTGGAQKAAEEIVNKLFTIFDVLFDISSKALHTKTKYSPQGFRMAPDYCEAEFSLTLALNITNYLLHRMKLSLFLT